MLDVSCSWLYALYVGAFCEENWIGKGVYWVEYLFWGCIPFLVLISINCLMQKYGLTSKLLSDFELLNKVCALYQKNQHFKLQQTSLNLINGTHFVTIFIILLNTKIWLLWLFVNSDALWQFPWDLFWFWKSFRKGIWLDVLYSYITCSDCCFSSFSELHVKVVERISSLRFA